MELDNSAAAEAGTAAPPAAQWVVFACSGQRYAVELARVREILTPRPFTRLPGAHEGAAGLIGVRSRIITAYDLGTLLGGRPAREQSDHRVLLADAGGRVTGLVVDEVLAAAALPVAPAGEANALVLAETEWEGEPVRALDLDALLARALQPVA